MSSSHAVTSHRKIANNIFATVISKQENGDHDEMALLALGTSTKNKIGDERDTPFAALEQQNNNNNNNTKASQAAAMSIRILGFFLLLIISTCHDVKAFTSVHISNVRVIATTTPPRIARPIITRRRRIDPLSVSVLNTNEKEDKARSLADERYMIEPEMLALALAPPVIGLFVWGGISQGVSHLFDSLNNFQNVGTRSICTMMCFVCIYIMRVTAVSSYRRNVF
jgi:hypothetical protein